MLALLFSDHAGALHLAALVFGIAAVTDMADGHLARSRDLITRFGRVADPIADKLLVGSALVGLVMVDRLALWIASVVVAREVGVSLLRWYAGQQGITIAVSGLGKAKTGVQMTAIPALMLVPDPSAVWVQGWLAALVTITVASGIDYALGYARRTSEPAAAIATATR